MSSLSHHSSEARPMRRAERELSEQAQVDAILDEAPVLYVSLKDEPAPYVVPLCFGREKDTLYVHSASEGTKIALLKADPRVGFCAATEMTVVPGATACAWGSRARSVAGTATARIVESDEERRRGLDAIMRHYAGAAAGSAVPQAADAGHSYAPGPLARTCLIALHIDTRRARRTG
jgi:nitroimidazol reductase NimA-like FMN-containing flavoprotein (pyridoxamine 5'-phosphate oxidase superfamily)